VSSVILRAKNLKTHELTDIPPIRLPPTHKQLAAQPTAVEARHFAATYALFRVCSMKNIHMMMPPTYRNLWKDDFQDLKKEDVAEGKGWMYEADPFQARRERDEAQALKEKKREMHEKERAAKASAPGGMAAQLGTSAADLTVGWKTAPKIEMGKKTRRTVEGLIRKHAVWNVHQALLPNAERHRVVEELTRLGFRPSHVEEAASVCKDREEILEWLLIHIPEDDLPRWSLPEGYVAGIVFASGDVKREGVVKRLSEGGYAVELCEEAYDGSNGNELVAAQHLQDSLFPDPLTSTSGEEADVYASTSTDPDAWTEELAVLSSIYEAKCDILNLNACQIRLDVPNFPHSITVKFQRPRGAYPNVLPVLTVLVSLPAYIRLSITKKALTYAQENLLGQQMIFNVVDWIEAELPNIVADPGRLSEVSSAGSATAERHGRNAHVRPVKRAKRARPINWQAGTERSRKLLTDYTERQNDPRQQKMLRSRQSLPAWNMRDAVVAAVTQSQVVIISGETGSGKSTQSVQFVLDDMIQRQLGDAASIICTQPRRISALGLADRVAEERCSQVGQEVGYAIRGESKQSQGVTKIVFVTTGVLLRRMQTSGGSTEDVVASLADISHVVVDEVHERSLDTDFLLALLQDVLRVRKDLKVILMSATLDADVFERYFSVSASVARVEISGRTYPVEDIYLDDVVRMTGAATGSQLSDSHGHGRQEASDDENLGGILRGLGMGINYELIANAVREIDRSLGTQPGAILIFLPGTMEISRALDALKPIPHLHALPLHASLLPNEQRRVFPPAPRGSRKVICSTNVAETSITIEDVVAVIDTGRVKETRYDPTTSMVRLEEVWASRAACKQRRGRAGRVSAGRCYKLYTRAMEARMAERPDPEIRRVPLEQLCLSVKAMGVADARAFLAGTLTPPESLAIEGAHALLRRVGALEGELLTPLGRHLAMIPADLRCAKLMVYGALFGCLEACVTMASILTSRSPFVAPREKRDEAKAARRAFGGTSGDVVADLRAYDAYVEQRRSSSSYRDVRDWCEQNFLSQQTLNDVHSTRTQYLASLKEIGFLPINYTTSGSGHHTLDDRSTAAAELNRNATSKPLLEALLLSALHPQTLRIALPTQKYAPTVSGTLAVDPEAHTIKFFDDTNARTFVHP